MKWKLLSVRLFVTHELYSPWNSPGQNTGVGGHSVLQGIFPTQGLKQVSHIAGRLLTSWATREVLSQIHATKVQAARKHIHSFIHLPLHSNPQACISTRAVPGTRCPAMQMTIPSFRGFTFQGKPAGKWIITLQAWPGMWMAGLRGGLALGGERGRQGRGAISAETWRMGRSLVG